MFHSFSAASLKRLQAVLPNIPRILIVGSLKRINFDVLTYVDGINLSSDLVTPQLVTQLHDLGKKVYVWDEMNEDRRNGLGSSISTLMASSLITPASATSFKRLRQLLSPPASMILAQTQALLHCQFMKILISHCCALNGWHRKPRS